MAEQPSGHGTGRRDGANRGTANVWAHAPEMPPELLNNLPCLIYRCRNDKQLTMEFVSPGARDLTGYTAADLTLNHKISYMELVHPQDREYVRREISRAVRTQRAFQLAYRIITASGKHKWVWGRGEPGATHRGKPTRLDGFISDVSPDRGTRENVERLNRLLRAVRNVTRLLVKEKDPNGLLRGICDNLVENRGYHNAWIALFDDSGNLTHAVETGLGDDFTPLLERLKQGQLTSCIRAVLSQQSPRVIMDPVSTCTDCPLSKKYVGRCGIAARLDYRGTVYGVLSASIPRHFLDDVGERDLFAEISGNLAFALHQMKLERRYEEAHEELRATSTYTTENPYPVFRIARDGTIVYANEGSRRVLEKWERHSGERVPADWRDRVQRVMMSGTKEEMEMEIDSDIFSFTIVPVEGIDYVNIYGLDITQRRLTEKALKKSERQFRDLVENSLVGIGIVHEGNVLYRNPEQERLWGPVSDGSGGWAFDHVFPQDAEKVEEGLRKIITGETPYVDMELRMASPKSEDTKQGMKWVHCRASVTEHHGKKAVLLNMMDVTRTKELERLLRMEDKMASLGRVAAGIAHEIRNPLSGINVYLSTLEKIYNGKGSPANVPGILERLKSASDKIESVIRRVMDFAKPGTPNFVDADIDHPVEEAVKLASVTLRKQGVKIEKKLSGNLPRLRIDVQMIESVVLNLITNAVEAMKDMQDQKTIRISSRLADDAVQVVVSDSGPGIPPDLQGSIFDPFYTTKNGSTGIGLSLSRRIVSDHGGTMGVSRGRLGGGRFTIQIPVSGEENAS